MSGDASVLAGLLIYLALMVVVGIAASRHMKTLDDFVLGGRRLGPWVAAISERASGESAWFLLGLPAAAYGLGFEGALRSITLGAAEILGIDERVGSLEVGKDGDIALYDGLSVAEVLKVDPMAEFERLFPIPA